VAGKGHETGQYVAGKVLPFDDREVTAAALRQAALRQAAQPAHREPAHRDSGEGEGEGEPGEGELGQPPLDVALQTWAVNR
jgi:hypothetical protein